MGQQGAYFGATIDIVTVRDQLRNLLSGLERFQGRAKQRLGWPVDLGLRGKQDFGRPIGGSGRAGKEQAFGRPVFFPRAGKHDFGRPIGLVAGGKHGFGFGVDLVRVLEALYARLDLLGERAGMAPGELDVAVALRDTLGRCRAGEVPRKLVEQVFKEQLDAVYGESDGAKTK